MKPMGTLLVACGKGNQAACKVARTVRAIYAGSVVSFQDASLNAQHPNKMPFKATLLICDEPSDKPPHGSQGHRILVTSEVAKSKLGGLPGMAVNYDPSDLDEHMPDKKVGVITKAWMEGPEVKIAGFVWKKDFPKAERDLKRKDLGTSMELADVYVKNEHANVWELNDFEFTGATILKRNAAAYTKTSLAASAKAAVHGEEGEHMSKKVKEEKQRKVAAASNDNGQLDLITRAIGSALERSLGPIMNEIKSSNQAVMDAVVGLHTIQAAAAEVNAADEEDDEVVVHAAEDDSDDMAANHDDSDDMQAHGHDDDSDDMAAAQMDDDESADDSTDDDSSELNAMEDLELDHADQEPGQVNKDATNRGSKTSVSKPPKQGEHFPGNVAKGRLHSAGTKGKGMKKPFPGLDAAAEIRNIYAARERKMKRQISAMSEQVQKSNRKVKKLTNTLYAMNERLEYFTDREARRSAIPVELTNLAGKSGVNLGELKAAGQQLSVAQVDSMFATAKMHGIEIAPEQRMAMKMQLEAEGLMENGAIERNYGRTN